MAKQNAKNTIYNYTEPSRITYTSNQVVFMKFRLDLLHLRVLSKADNRPYFYISGTTHLKSQLILKGDQIIFLFIKWK